MPITLKLTNKEVNQLINGGLNDGLNDELEERFEEIFDDIPFYHPDHVPEKGETHRDYCEDDGREFHWLIFKDVITGIEYCIDYTYNEEWPNDINSLPDSIQIVSDPKESSLYVAPVAQ